MVSPDIILTHAPADYMEDHSTTSRLVCTAAFVRGMRNFNTTPHTAHVLGVQDMVIYHAQPYMNRDAMRQFVLPELFVSIDSVRVQKRAMLAKHASQKQWLDESQGFDSYLDSSDSMSQELADVARSVLSSTDPSAVMKYAEGWRRHNHIGYARSADADPLTHALLGAVHVNKRFLAALTPTQL